MFERVYFRFWFFLVCLTTVFLTSCGDDESSIAKSKSRIEYSVLEDVRDGQTYKTVKIGNQWWMAENLNYSYHEGSAKSFCYKNNSKNCDLYGRLYTWSAAMDSAAIFSTDGKDCGDDIDIYSETKCNPDYPVRGVCPEGWHLPSLEEFEIMLDLVGVPLAEENNYRWANAGKLLKSPDGWCDEIWVENEKIPCGGSDDFGFSALGGGGCDFTGDFEKMELYAFFVSSTRGYAFGSDVYRVHTLELSAGGGTAEIIGKYVQKSAYSVRCVKD